MKRAVSLFVALLVLSCSRSQQPRPGYGAVMAEIGQRFELAGRAAVAHRFELASFEVDEMRERFEGDLSRAELPKEGPTSELPPLADAFVKAHPPELAKAAKAKDEHKFAEAFQRAAAACNACHQASGHGFIQVPSAPGKAVPDLDPLPAP